MWGISWLTDAWKYIIEDQQSKLQFQMLLAPIYRTPMSKEAGRAIESYSSKVRRQIEGLTPWRKSGPLMRRTLEHSGIKPGEITVILEPGENANDPLYQGAKIVRSHG